MVSLPSLLLPAAAAALAASSVSPAPTPLPPPRGPGHPGGTLAVGDLHARDVDEGSGILDGVLPRPRLPSSPQGTVGPGTGRQSSAPGARGPTGPAAGPPARSEVRGGWAWPLSPVPRVVRRFTAPISAWGPGHRGVDLAGSVGQQVRAAAPGRVTHVGVVAGRPTLSVLHTSGVRTTYEPVVAAVGLGDTVEIGTVLGSLAAVGSHCPGAVCLHFGALRGRTYLDPLRLLRGGPVILLPLR